MNLKEMKKKVLGLIEELNPNHELLTDDIDISTKHNSVINQVMYELARLKKIPKYFEMEVKKGDLVSFADFEKECGNEVFQIAVVSGVKYLNKASGTVFKILEDGILEVDCFVYPERITDNTKDNAYEFELSADALEIMPFGVAADLLKSDVSTEYGSIYASRYESMKQLLDPRYQMPSITIEGGVTI
jgi:hypothetical protein